MKTVLSLHAHDAPRVREAFAQDAQHVDLVELRLDACSAELGAELVRASPRGVIATVMPREEGGSFDGSLEERLARLAAASRAGARYVDLDRAHAAHFAALGGSAELIVSVHDREPCAPGDVRAEILELARAFPQAALKRVYRVQREEQCAAIYAGLRAARAVHARPVVAFSMGEHGHGSRVLSGVHGSAWTYLASSETAQTAAAQWSVAAWQRAVPLSGIDTTTQVFGVVGRPVARSLSPAVHGAWFRALQRNAVYLRFAPDDARAFFEGHARGEVGVAAQGFSVTQPMKELAWRFADEASAAAEAMEAANTLVRTSRGWRAENTDAPAVVDAFESAGARIAGSRALVLGAGGAARAAALALRLAGAEVTLALREPAKAAAFAERHGLRLWPWSERERERFGLLVNATPLGSHAALHEVPIGERALGPGMHVLDMVYRPRRTALLRAAERAGAILVEGLAMFLAQAQRQSELFTGQRAPLELLREAAARELAREGEA
ncbi:MAG: type I 3-dehydroquinate dehydratase [Planctomycetes bacterium]|nr:type I 3-dehydroquinate dehydratase [Planctomycetota bacterium]